MTPLPSRDRFRFGDFVLDLAACQLRRRDRPVKLGRQAMDVLILLVERRGELVARADIIGRLWGADVFVDVETGVNTAISKVRQALGDEADAPTYVETVPGRGYRFVAHVERMSGEAVTALSAPPEPLPPSPAPPAAPPSTGSRATRWSGLARPGLAVAVLVIGLGVAGWVSMPKAPARISLAVLPFENVGSDPERAYLATGLTEETSASLAQIDPERLSVKGRTLRYKGTTQSAVEIGRELAVDYLVEGSIRTDGTRLRVTATVIRVHDEEHIWTQSFEPREGEALTMQQELSTAIAQQIRLRLSSDSAPGVARRQTSSAAAYDAYLRARYLGNRRTPATNVQSIQEYQRAVDLDENYALAWAGLSFTYASSALNGDGHPLEIGPPARAAAAQAIAANPALAEAQYAVAFTDWVLNWKWTAAEAGLRRAIELDASDGATHRTLGHVLSQAGRHAEAEAEMRRARELEPFEAFTHAISAQVAYQARDYPGAIEHARRAILIDSQLWIGYAELATAQAALGDVAPALEALTDAMRFSGGNSKAQSLRGYLLARLGRVAEAREVLRTLEAAARERYVPPYAMALVNAGLSDSDAVFTWLEAAYAARDVHLIYLTVDPNWDPYRDDARFQTLLAKCGFALRTAN